MAQIGWDNSAAAWIDGMGSDGDATRKDILDTPMLAALPTSGEMLDIGCGEGRFCRMAKQKGLQTVGLDPTKVLLETAQARDPKGEYTRGDAQELPFDDARFDAVVFYMSLIDIPDHRRAIQEATRVLKTGGRLLVANLHPHATARPPHIAPEDSSWLDMSDGNAVYSMDQMMDERPIEVTWAGLHIINHHRPLSSYMQAMLGAGLQLVDFADPPYRGSDKGLAKRYRRMPWAFMMEWQKR